MHRRLGLWGFVLPLAAGSACDAEPLSLAITDVQVDPDVEGSYMRGIPATVGSPQRDVVLLPWAELNNTWIYDDESFCDDTVIWNDLICEIRRGNLFLEQDSKSYYKASDIIEAGGASDEVSLQGSEQGIKKLVSTGLGGTDNLTLNGTGSLSEFPIGIPRLRWDHGYTFLHSLGMGSNSTYLNALRDAGRISSRVWSVFWGRMWVDEPLDGMVVVGGYDSEKVIGDNFTAPLDYTDFDGSTGCWTGMKVIVRDIQLNFRDGSDISIFPSNMALPCCIVPQRQLLLEGPGTIFDLFEQTTGVNHTGDSFGLHWSAKIFDADTAFDGDMTLHLESGLQIRVPNDQYMTPFVDINREGKRVIDDSRREFLMNPVGDQPATLGRYFLTAAYLMVNHDAKTFTLWQANPSSSSKLVRVFDEEASRQCGDASGVVQPSATPKPTPSTDPLDENSSSGNDESGPSAAVIGGAVGGGGGGLLILGLVVFLLVRKRRQRASEPATAASFDMQQYSEDQKKYYSGGFGHSVIQEMPGSQPSVSEAQDRWSRYELDASAVRHSRTRL